MLAHLLPLRADRPDAPTYTAARVVARHPTAACFTSRLARQLFMTTSVFSFESTRDRLRDDCTALLSCPDLLRDLLVGAVPPNPLVDVLLRADVYATAAMAGAAVHLLALRHALSPRVAGALGVATCFSLRVISVWRGGRCTFELRRRVTHSRTYRSST
jgi:hypothetical protein